MINEMQSNKSLKLSGGGFDRGLKRLLFLLLASTLLTGSYAYGEPLQIDGGTYTGEVVDGRAHGQGTWTHPEGYKYAGQFKDDKFHGQGTLTLSDGNKYVGQFKDDSLHGQGALTAADGNKYVGEFKDNKMHGQGTYTWPNGDRYVGEWKDHKQWQGIEYLSSGKIAATFSNSSCS